MTTTQKGPLTENGLTCNEFGVEEESNSDQDDKDSDYNPEGDGIKITMPRRDDSKEKEKKRKATVRPSTSSASSSGTPPLPPGKRRSTSRRKGRGGAMGIKAEIQSGTSEQTTLERMHRISDFKKHIEDRAGTIEELVTMEKMVEDCVEHIYQFVKKNNPDLVNQLQATREKMKDHMTKVTDFLKHNENEKELMHQLETTEGIIEALEKDVIGYRSERKQSTAAYRVEHHKQKNEHIAMEKSLSECRLELTSKSKEFATTVERQGAELRRIRQESDEKLSSAKQSFDTQVRMLREAHEAEMLDVGQRLAKADAENEKLNSLSEDAIASLVSSRNMQSLPPMDLYRVASLMSERLCCANGILTQHANKMILGAKENPTKMRKAASVAMDDIHQRVIMNGIGTNEQAPSTVIQQLEEEQQPDRCHRTLIISKLGSETNMSDSLAQLDQAERSKLGMALVTALRRFFEISASFLQLEAVGHVAHMDSRTSMERLKHFNAAVDVYLEQQITTATCIACCESLRTHCAVPCGHALLCATCIQKMAKTQCPVCRVPVQAWQPFVLS